MNQVGTAVFRSSITRGPKQVKACVAQCRANPSRAQFSFLLAKKHPHSFLRYQGFLDLSAFADVSHSSQTLPVYHFSVDGLELFEERVVLAVDRLHIELTRLFEVVTPFRVHPIVQFIQRRAQIQDDGSGASAVRLVDIPLLFQNPTELSFFTFAHLRYEADCKSSPLNVFSAHHPHSFTKHFNIGRAAPLSPNRPR